MNYQLMFQTIAVICGTAAFLLGIPLLIMVLVKEETKRYILFLWCTLFIITLITSALAAGLS